MGQQPPPSARGHPRGHVPGQTHLSPRSAAQPWGAGADTSPRTVTAPIRAAQAGGGAAPHPPRSTGEQPTREETPHPWSAPVARALLGRAGGGCGVEAGLGRPLSGALRLVLEVGLEAALCIVLGWERGVRDCLRRLTPPAPPDQPRHPASEEGVTCKGSLGQAPHEAGPDPWPSRPPGAALTRYPKLMVEIFACRMDHRPQKK